jgi:cell division ATPase FtsA
VPRTIPVNHTDIRRAIEACVSAIVSAVREALERTPPELCSDIVDRGVVLTGGCALLRNLDVRLHHDTGLPVSIAHDPLTSVVVGTGKLLGDFKLLRRVPINSRNARCGWSVRGIAPRPRPARSFHVRLLLAAVTASLSTPPSSRRRVRQGRET